MTFGPSEDGDHQREDDQPTPDTEGAGKSSGTNWKKWIANATNTVITNAAGRPATTWAFHDPFRHPTDRSNDAMATVITTTGNHPVVMEKLTTSSIRS
jgi:hypothetical protein